MNDKKLLALMYDFYNKKTLKAQNEDIKYYISQIKRYKAKKVLIIGAGTGRVAIPLAKWAIITALDFDNERLKILNEKDYRIRTICADFLKYNTDETFDLIIIPYSTLQFDCDEIKMNRFFISLYKIMSLNTIVIFDVSESFNSKPNKHNELIVEDYYPKVKDRVEVYYTSVRHKKYIEFFIKYKLTNSNISVIENERYYYYNKELLLKLISNNNLELINIDDGYGNDVLKHKHLYHIKKYKGV